MKKVLLDRDYEIIQKSIKDYEKMGIYFWVDNGKLKYKAPKNILTNKILFDLKKSKDEIIEYLTINTFQENRNEDSFSLMPIQQAYLTGRNEEYELGGINAHYYFEINCRYLDIHRFQEALNQVIKHNDALRTVILPTGYQKVLGHVPGYTISFIEFCSEEDSMNARKNWSHHMYELEKWPMYEIKISRLYTGNYRLHISFDCIVMDAWSIKMMVAHIFSIYQDKKVVWPKYTFKDYCIEEKKYRQNENNNEADAYWENILKNLPDAPKLPFKQHLRKIKKPRFSRLHCKLTREETRLLYKKARLYRFTPAAVICTAYMKTLSKYSYEKDLTLNLTVFNRLPLNPDVQKLLGDFTNVGLAFYLHNKETFLREIKNVQMQFWNLIKFKNFNGLEVIKKLSKYRPGRAVMPVVFTGVLQGLRERENDLPSGIEQVFAISQTPQVVLDYQATDFTGELSVNWDYVIGAFEEETIQQIFEVHLKFLKKIIAEPEWEKSIEIEI